jgi:hypothetical protein
LQGSRSRRRGQRSSPRLKPAVIGSPSAVTTLPFSIEVRPNVGAVFAAGLADIFFTRRAVCVNSPTLLAALRPHWLGGLPRVQALLRLLPEIVGTAPGTGILRPETGGEIALTPRTETGIGKTEDKKPRQWRAFLDGLRKVRKQQTGWWRQKGSNWLPTTQSSNQSRISSQEREFSIQRLSDEIGPFGPYS